jgi:hypothetical protein
MLITLIRKPYLPEVTLLTNLRINPINLIIPGRFLAML